VGIITTYNTHALSTYLLAEQSYSGVMDLNTLELARLDMPEGATPHYRVLRETAPAITFNCKLTGTSATMASNLASVLAILRPDYNFHSLVVSTRTSKEIMALCMGLPLEIASDAQYQWRFPVTFQVYPYWQDASNQTAAITASPTVVANAGDMTTYPVYTITVASAMSGGMWFQVGSVKFEWTKALAPGDVLVVYSDIQIHDVTLNGTRDWTGVKDTYDEFPALAVGNNTVTFTDPAKCHIDMVWKRRYR
jgi:phage-related protein